MIKQAVIIAGGLGSRLKPFTESSPKPMYIFREKPFIEYLVLQVKDFGINEVVILLGYLPEKIMNYLGDGSQYGVRIIYDITPVEYNTGGRMMHARCHFDDYFLFMYCDNYCPIDYQKLEANFYSNNAWIQLSVYENKDSYTKSNIRTSEDGCVIAYDKTRVNNNLQGVDIGYAIINKHVLDFVQNSKMNFETAVYPEIIRKKRMYATITRHRYYSVGSWNRIELTKQFFENPPTVFLDRDGTVNTRAERACYIERPEQFNWIAGAKEAISLLKASGCRVLMVTNQPGIARGRLTLETLEDIHRKMQQDLSEKGAAIDKIYVCPHNWEDGCDCRKPNPGMFYQAQKEFSLNLSECYMIGDDDRDMKAGKNAGCRCILVSEDYPLLSAVKDLLQTITGQHPKKNFEVSEKSNDYI